MKQYNELYAVAEPDGTTIDVSAYWTSVNYDGVIIEVTDWDGFNQNYYTPPVAITSEPMLEDGTSALLLRCTLKPANDITAIMSIYLDGYHDDSRTGFMPRFSATMTVNGVVIFQQPMTGLVGSRKAYSHALLISHLLVGMTDDWGEDHDYGQPHDWYDSRECEHLSSLADDMGEYFGIA